MVHGVVAAGRFVVGVVPAGWALAGVRATVVAALPAVAAGFCARVLVDLELPQAAKANTVTTMSA
jgi:hypothetical protein